jgi:hypothetical protein
MKVLPYFNGKKIERDKEDLEFIELDIVYDLVRSLETFETNPNAEIEVDLSTPGKPSFHMVNCSSDFENRFYEIMQKEKVFY